MPATLWKWILFHLLIFLLLVLDLGVFHRKSHALKGREAWLWSLVWIGLALLFNLGIYLFQGTQPALQFFTGYLLEKSLSVDNLFVFFVLFSYFQVPAQYQHKILYWGILGALITRGLFIGMGLALLRWFSWTLYGFGALLIFASWAMLRERPEGTQPEKNIFLRFFRSFLPITEKQEGGAFFTRENGRFLVTPFLMILLVIESSDVLFAVDSIPAVLAVSRDAFIVYTSNIFAILGLRALYFVLAALLQSWTYLRPGLALLLLFLGMKMILSDLFPLSLPWSLGVILVLLSGTALLSWLFPLPSRKP